MYSISPVFGLIPFWSISIAFCISMESGPYLERVFFTTVFLAIARKLVDHTDDLLFFERSLLYAIEYAMPCCLHCSSVQYSVFSNPFTSLK